MIMTVLRRDTDLKKAEELRISKMEKLLDGSQPNTQLKYRTGEWFYKAKSLRHMDNIHGSEIILASMKPRKAGLDGSLRIERSKTPSSRGLDIVAPPKPARCLEELQLQEMNNAEKELLNSTVRSPRMPRHNPFNRASLIVVEPPETNDDRSTRRDQESSETEPIYPLKSHAAGTSQTSGGSLTSDGSSGGFRPVPKKRTFLSRRSSSQSESTSKALDTQGGSAGIVPAPRLSLQRGSSENSNQSYVKGQDEVPQKSVVSNEVSQPSKHNNSQQPSQVSSNSSLERERYTPSITRDRPATFTRSDASTDREIPQKSDERDDRKQRELAGLNTFKLHSGSIQDSAIGNNSSVGTSMRQGELSLLQSTVDADPPVSYDLNFIDKSAETTQNKSNQKNAFQLSTQTSSPTGDEGDSIAKSRKQRQNADKGASSRRSSEDTESQIPRARACVPRDFRHYLGMTDKSSVHTSPVVKGEGSEEKPGYEFDLVGPVRASTPACSEERHSRRGSKTTQHPLWANYSSSEAGPESSVSSTSETWSSSRNSSNRKNVLETQNLVTKALRRAEARPKTLAKSMEDITASLSPRQERRQDPTADMRRISNVSSIPSPTSSLFSDPEHLKNMSKSVPSFLQKEDTGRDTDSTCEDSDHPERIMKGSSLNNLTGSSGMASLSSLSGSVMTMYSGDFVEVQGNIQFSINYIQKLREFHIFVAQCQDLAAVDPKRGRSDPYVKSYLVPDKANLGKRKTSVKKKTLSPTFNEILRYRVRMEYLRTQTLILSIWHHDTFGRNSFLGEVDVDLSKWDFDHTQMNYLALKARTLPTLAPYMIIHSEGLVKEGPSTGEIHIWVKECKNLPLIRATIDPYVKCFVLPDTSRKSRQKTRVLQRTVDPAFNHTMVYDGIRQADLSEACVELTVWDRDRLASNLLGGLRIGAGTGRSYGALVDWMDSTPFEAALWERMMVTPNEWVEDILPLRVLNSAKTGFK
ncbi:hypothetical protein KUCAC02_005867 [Chaenocephalus aceratus]|uniref:Uncharacterized protein n=1 Tax=Chaenocephalus aceratus TaxID=36190 RepID=A0ACB9WRA6_CHAAC|nr:hypothetical protein KUCAC02_005867 [Chaenocephalus aceratus]